MKLKVWIYSFLLMTINCLEIFKLIVRLHYCKEILTRCIPGQKNSLFRFFPDKHYSINIPKKLKQHCHGNYKINNKDQESKSDSEVLGIIIEENFHFSNYIIHKVHKAINSFNFTFNCFCILIYFIKGTSCAMFSTSFYIVCCKQMWSRTFVGSWLRFFVSLVCDW